MCECAARFNVNKYDGLGVMLMGMRYQASPIYQGDHPGLPDESVYAHSYRRVLQKAMRKFAPCVEPTGQLTGNHSSAGVGRQIALATVTVTVERA